VIGLLDYGAGNLASVRKALTRIGAPFETLQRPGDLARCDGLLVPGVGSFRMVAAIDAAWRRAVLDHVARGRPVLGVCLGMQWLFEGSVEAPEAAGLGLLSGMCTRLPEAGVKVPHVGWHGLRLARPSWSLAGLSDSVEMYFTHAYAAPISDAATATVVHGVAFAAAVERENVAGVQFHPEKSGVAGLVVLRNFLARVESVTAGAGNPSEDQSPDPGTVDAVQTPHRVPRRS
jgi:glutamine amidotransferase